MSEVLCAAPLQRRSDFFQESGEWIDGACGPTALANAASSALGRAISPKSVYDLMRSHPGPGVDGRLCDPNGASTIETLRTAALLLGCEVATYQGYGEPWNGWEIWLAAQMALGNPVVMEGALCQNLKDSVTGLGNNYVNTLDYHYYDVVGYLSAGTSSYAEKTFNKLITVPGFWCGDGDSWAGNNGIEWNFNCADQLQFYPSTIIAAARPCAALALKGRPTVMAWTTQTNGDGKDAAGHVCSPGFMAAMKDNPADLAADGLSSSVALPNDTAFLALSNGTLYVADPPTAPFKRFAAPDLAQEWMKLYDLYAAAEAKASTPVQTDPTAVALVAALKAALA